MASVDLAFQKVLFAQITAALPAVTCAATPIHGQALPFIQIGDCEVSDHPIGHQLIAQVHCWSSKEGPDDVKVYQDAIRSAFHGDAYSQDGWNFYVIREDYADSIPDPSNEAWHGVQRLRVLACA